MDVLFLKLLNMSVAGGWVILAVIFLRFLLRKAPRWSVCLLWMLVAFRLVFPNLPESDISILPSSEIISSLHIDEAAFSINSGFSVIDRPVNEYLNIHSVEGNTATVSCFARVITVFGYVWLIGIISMLTYMAVSYLRLKKRIMVSVQFEENIYLSDEVITPFICGFIQPKIYLPSDIGAKESSYVIAHEKGHLARRDHLLKPLGFVLLSIHWFNPLVWVGYTLFCRDIEIACDEKVIKKLDNSEKKAYSLTLLSFGAIHQRISVCPLAFGELGIKERVKKVLSYKKPTIWIIISALLVCIVSAMLLLTDPKVSAMSGDDLGSEKQYGYALFEGFENDSLIYLDMVEYITSDDTERVTELGLGFADMPNGYYINNPEDKTTAFSLSNKTLFVFFDWNEKFTDNTNSRYTVENRWISTNDVKIFADYLAEYSTEDINIPFEIEVNGDSLVRIAEIMVP